MIFTLVLLAVLIPAVLVFLDVRKKNLLVWLGSYFKQDWRATVEVKGPRHVMFCFVIELFSFWAVRPVESSRFDI